MKKATLVSTLLTLLALISVGCTKAQTQPDIKARINEILKQSEQDSKKNLEFLNELEKSLSYGGQPGTITLTGVAVIDADKIDSRISISQEAGLDSSSSATAMSDKVKVLKSLSSEEAEKASAQAKKLEEQRTYINIGCELAESEIAGLTEVDAKAELAKETVLVSASRIFICNELKSSKVLLDLSASEIMLKDASILANKNLGILNLKAATLVLVGKNKIASLGQDDSGYVLSSASISLNVSKEIFGDGELSISSKGGNNIAPAKKE